MRDLPTEQAPTRALFTPLDHPGEADREHWLPTDLARGPWSPDALHGGPVAALLARALERLASPVPMRLARLTVELLRPVPPAPLWLEATVVRDGAKVGMLEARLGRLDTDEPVAVARAQRIRTKEVAFHDHVTGTEVVPDVPPDPTPIDRAYVAYHNSAVEHRFARGVFGEPGAAFDWIRLTATVVPDEEPTGWQRVAAAADFANGISSVVPWDGTTVFINPDLTITLWREPEGELVGLDAVTRTSGAGIGASDAALWDVRGRIGRANQSLLLDRF